MKPHWYFSDTGYAHNWTDSVQDALSAYRGDDVWSDVILDLDEYDEAATALVDIGQTGNAFVAGGVEYRWRPDLLSDGIWRAEPASLA